MRSLFAFSATCRRVLVTAMSIGVCLFGIGARDARADIVVAFAGVEELEDGGFRWHYEVGIAFDQEIQSGDIFSIYDFFGFTGAGDTTAPDGWDFLTTTFSPLAVCPGGPPCASLSDPNPPNDELIPDLTWQYTGDTISSDTEFPFNSPLGVFTAVSEFGEETAVAGWFAGLAHFEDDPETTEVDESLTVVFNSELDPDVPSNPVPEPGSMVLLATGLFGAAAMIRRRQATKV